MQQVHCRKTEERTKWAVVREEAATHQDFICAQITAYVLHKDEARRKESTKQKIGKDRRIKFKYSDVV